MKGEGLELGRGRGRRRGEPSSREGVGVHVQLEQVTPGGEERDLLGEGGDLEVLERECLLGSCEAGGEELDLDVLRRASRTRGRRGGE